MPQAKFALARLYEAQNKPEQARKLYEEIARSGSLRLDWAPRPGMRLEELKIKYPNLRSARPVRPPRTADKPANTRPELEYRLIGRP